MALLLFTASVCFADFEPCEVVARWSSIISVSCPAGIENPKIAKVAYDIQKTYGRSETRKILFFSEKRLTPRNSSQISQMSEKTFERVFLGQVTYNGPNGEQEFRCKVGPEKMGNCTAYLK